jgi:acetoin utilization deacetylase AcuC-like enzyme
METLKKRFEVLEPEPCTERDILLCHTPSLLEEEKANSGRYEVARLAAGGAILASQLAFENTVPFAAIRPPGHHAGADRNWGFCFFNNMAIALSKLLKEGRINSAAVLDIDLHYGDGTVNIFENDSRVKILNPQDQLSEDYIKEVEVFMGSVEETDIVAVSAGFDEYEKDWGGTLSTEDYRTLGEMAGAFARKKAKGRIFALLEGGYYIPDLGKNALALVEGMKKGLEG